MPESTADIFPNRVQYVYGTPVVVFRDHRWVLPVIHHAAERGLVGLPVRLITFDRHRDALEPEDDGKVLGKLRDARFSLEELVNIVKYRLSPRDDDWILAGMELGLISDVVQFCGFTDESGASTCFTEYIDSAGCSHRIFHLGRPAAELSYKGALADGEHEAVRAGLWDVLGADPGREELVAAGGGFIFDMDLDYFTISWEVYTLPYTEEIYAGEFLNPCQSDRFEDYPPALMVRELMRKAAVSTLATEPRFCGGVEKAEAILNRCNHFLFGNRLKPDEIEVDYRTVYPSE